MVSETARAASVAAAAAAASAIPPMTWGDATPEAFLAQWAGVIAVQDPHGKEEDPHVYLIKKLFQTLETIRRPGSFGWRFREAGPSSCVPAFVWADGSPQQLTEYGTQQLTEYAKWWPCIVLVCDAQTLVLPFYCPALAWQGARPWGVHITRLRLRACIVDSSALSTAQQRLPLSTVDSSATPATQHGRTSCPLCALSLPIPEAIQSANLTLVKATSIDLEFWSDAAASAPPPRPAGPPPDTPTRGPPPP